MVENLKKKKQEKETKISSKGITLIALIITIIVLLILAGVTIATLTGEHGILTQAEDAKTKTTKAEAEERFKLIANEWQIEKAQGTSLEDFLADKKESGELDKVTKNSDGTFNIEFKGEQQIIDNYGNLTGGGETPTPPSFDPETLEIGTAINADKYGWKVEDYKVKAISKPATATADPVLTSGIWRLFYQDSNYTYLITDELVGKFRPSDYYTTITNEEGELKYQTGADVSTVGQKLSPIISSLFTESNTNPNIRFTAWMTDPEVWKDYKDKNGDAVFAIGSPTAELFAKSYNSTGKTNAITLGSTTLGYTENTGSNWLNVSDNYGIYNKDDSSYWWLASPYDGSGFGSSGGLGVYGYYGDFLDHNVDYESYAVRPTVCIPTSVFNSNYSDSVVAEQ